MSPGGTLVALLAAMHQDDVVSELRRRQRGATTPVRRRSDDPLTALRRVFHGRNA